MPVTIPVSDVALGSPLPTVDRSTEIPKLLGAGERGAVRGTRTSGAPVRQLEQMWQSGARLVATTEGNALALAAHDAFYMHHPLRLTPDAVWFTLAQGFATHVGLHAETLRKRFVKHEGKVKLVVERRDFFLGQPNPWPEAFAAFSDQIASHVGRLRDLVVADFSTTGPLERAASEVVLMDTFQAYFEYVMMCGCGIPSVVLEGTPDDWRSVRRRAAMLSEFGLEHWTNALLPVLDEIVRSAEGSADRAFWRSFFRYQSGSGPSELTGWILTLFPYVKTFANGTDKLVPSPYLADWEARLRRAEAPDRKMTRSTEGPGLGALPPSLASAPVTVIDVRDGSTHPLRFVAGLFGVTQDDGRVLAPEFGWAVVHDGEAQR
jgi:hypothetical protein